MQYLRLFHGISLVKVNGIKYTVDLFKSKVYLYFIQTCFTFVLSINLSSATIDFMNSSFLLMDHKYKKWLIAMVGLGLALSGLELATGAVLIPRLSPGMHLHFCLWFTFVNLLSLAVCKEKIEDERVRLIRSKAMMRGFLFTCAVILGFSVNVSLFPIIAPDAFVGVTFGKEDYSYMGMMLMVFPAFSIVSYLIKFNYGLRNDENWDFNDTMTRGEQLRKNKKYLILRTVVSLIILAIIILLGRMSK
jgi:hypothetical protein